jgi:ribose transport system permease protein
MSATNQQAAPDVVPGPRPAGAGLQLGRVRDYGIVLSFIALFVTLSVSSDVFLTSSNLLNILDQQAAVLIIAAAGTLVLVSGGFDISVGAVYGLAGVVAAKVAVDVNPILGLFAGVGAGIAAGTLNGLLATKGRINSLIATLSTMFMMRGLAIVVTGGVLIVLPQESDFAFIGNAELLGVRYTIWIMVVLVALMAFLLARTVFGRYIYAAGGNAEAARLSGVNVDMVRAATFVISGFAAGLGGVLATSRVVTGQADAGLGLEFSVIAGIVVGGTSIAGGEGAVWRTVLGVLFIALIGNGFDLLGIDVIYQQIVQGAIIIVAVAVDAWSRRTP